MDKGRTGASDTTGGGRVGGSVSERMSGRLEWDGVFVEMHVPWVDMGAWVLGGTWTWDGGTEGHGRERGTCGCVDVGAYMHVYILCGICMQHRKRKGVWLPMQDD